LGLAFFILFTALLVISILVRSVNNVSTKAEIGPLMATFYFVGSIIFGGGPVIIPILRGYVVANGWMSDEQFLVGLALIQAMPGPNFNFAAFLGAAAMVNAGKNGIIGAILSYISIFLPGLLLKSAIIPYWQ